MIDPTSILVASLAGTLLGAIVLGQLAATPTYASAATPGEVGRIVAACGIVVGLVFFFGQAAIDRQYEAAVGTFANWTAYSVGIGIGTWLRLLVDETQRHETIRDMAKRQVDDESRRDG